MAKKYVTAIRTAAGDLPIDYNSLANLPDPSDHSHSTENITSGTLPVTRGGIGTSSLTSGAAVIGNGTNAVTTRTIRNNTATSGNITADNALITSNTLKNAINRTTSVAASDNSDGTVSSPKAVYMARGIALYPEELTPTVNGAIMFIYE